MTLIVEQHWELKDEKLEVHNKLAFESRAENFSESSCSSDEEEGVGHAYDDETGELTPMVEDCREVEDCSDENDADSCKVEIYYDDDGNFVPVTNISFPGSAKDVFFPESDDSETKDHELFPDNCRQHRQ